MQLSSELYFMMANSIFQGGTLTSDWLKNAIATPLVKITINDTTFSGYASLVKDKKLAKKISSMKYTDRRAEESRTVLEVIPCE